MVVVGAGSAANAPTSCTQGICLIQALRVSDAETLMWHQRFPELVSQRRMHVCRDRASAGYGKGKGQGKGKRI